MLAEFRVENFRSFRDEQVLSLLICSKESENNKESVQIGKYRILKTIALYGPNASGKSNLIKAITCMHNIVRNSATKFNLNDKLPITPFLFDRDTQKQPSKFEVTFFIDNVRYQYGFSATLEKIHGEWLSVYPKGRPQIWFERKQDRINFGPSLKGRKNEVWEQVKDNCLFLSMAGNRNHKQLTPVYKWISDKLRLIPAKGIDRYFTAKILYDVKTKELPKQLGEDIKEIIRKADFGIKDIDTKPIPMEKLVFPDDFPDDLKGKILKNPPFDVAMSHLVDEQEYTLSIEEESEGTQRFFALLGPWLETIANGYTICFDELDASLHSLLTRGLVEMIKSNSTAQLIFTTHDTTLLDPDLLCRDQVWFTEKNEDSATQLYSLADYKDIRKDEAMQKRYLAGKYGAIPIIEKFDLITDNTNE